MNDRSFIDTIKTYPINVEIQTLRTYGMTAGKLPTSQSGSATVSLTTSIVLLPREPMTPRLYDERVGYFNNKIIQFNDDDAPEYDAYISRYRLEPKNLKAYKAGKLVEPKQQIVFYIDPATPKKWVKYLKMGIDDWNVAFEAAGFKNAIVAKDWPNDTTMSMDDARFNYVAQPEDKIGEKGLFPRINDYDKWAIKWGYQYRPEFSDPYKEKKALRAETTKALENRRLWWCGDEGKGTDPRSQTEDLGDNQMLANEYGIKNLKRVMQNIMKWTAQPDGQYDDLSTVHKGVRGQFQRYVNHVQKYLAGRYVNNAPGQPAHDYVPRALQQEALQWLDRHVLDAPYWLYPDDVVQCLGINATDEIRNRQQTLVALLLSPGMLLNQHEASLRASSPYPVADYLNDVFAAVWKPLNDKDERQNDFRRQQERSYVYFVGRILNPSDQDKTSVNTNAQRSDVVLYAEQHLDQIEQYLKAQQATGINARHYKNLLLQVKKIREKYESDK